MTHDEYRKRGGTNTDAACSFMRRAEVNFVLGDTAKAEIDLEIAADYLRQAADALKGAFDNPGPVGGKL